MLYEDRRELLGQKRPGRMIGQVRKIARWARKKAKVLVEESHRINQHTMAEHSRTRPMCSVPGYLVLVHEIIDQFDTVAQSHLGMLRHRQDRPDRLSHFHLF